MPHRVRPLVWHEDGHARARPWTFRASGGPPTLPRSGTGRRLADRWRAARVASQSRRDQDEPTCVRHNGPRSPADSRSISAAGLLPEPSSCVILCRRQSLSPYGASRTPPLRIKRRHRTMPTAGTERPPRNSPFLHLTRLICAVCQDSRTPVGRSAGSPSRRRRVLGSMNITHRRAAPAPSGSQQVTIDDL